MQAAAESYHSSFLKYDIENGSIFGEVSNQGLDNFREFFLEINNENLNTHSNNIGAIAREPGNDASFIVYQPKRTINSLPRPVINESFIEIKKWEGKIISINSKEETFVAEIRDAQMPDIEEEASFNFDDINESDRHFLSEGAIFYWSIGYKRTVTGGREKVSMILFRMLPAWNIDSKKIDERTAHLTKLFSDEQA